MTGKVIKNFSSIEEIRQYEKLEEFKSVLGIICSKMTLPLYFVFWLADLIYAPELKWEFLALRSTVIPISFLCMYLVKKVNSADKMEYVALMYVAGVSIPIAVMGIMVDGASTPYYAGLNLIAVGGLSFLPFSKRSFILGILATYLPFFSLSFFFTEDIMSFRLLLLNSFFMVGTVIICFLIRHFNERLRVSEIQSKFDLQDAINNRDRVIKTKTEEGIKLQALSNQFSPQVVHAIRSGEIDLEGRVHRSRICSIFIDIVNSTDRVVRIDKDSVDKVISMFMEDTIKTLLKYDITVDKFLGDGILAFSNDPIKYSDYVERVCLASQEIIQRIQSRKEEYEDYWMKEMEVCIGIAIGFANVGFYGSDRYFKAYTAIGPVVNMASRLCSEALPNQILMSKDVVNEIDSMKFETEFIGKKNLKGFSDDVIKVYELKISDQLDKKSTKVYDCPKCDNILHLATSPEGFYTFKCRSCGFVMDNIDDFGGNSSAA